MSIDAIPETRGHPQPSGAQQGSDRQGFLQGRWWKRGLTAMGVIAVIAATAVLIRGTGSSREIGPRLTHTIKRGDLVVSVTEQGTLESSDNLEIKWVQLRSSPTVHCCKFHRGDGLRSACLIAATS